MSELGLFVHWDHASQQGLEVSWPLVGGVFALPKAGDVPVEQYHSSAATFDPVEFDAGALAGLAARAGMSYAVFTAKHHAGYAMWPTALSSYRSERDLVGEFVSAVRAAGLKVGLYFSLPDWSHPDYPAFTEADKPYRLGQSPPLPTAEQWDRYWEYLRGQLEELLTGYGKVDVLWFDGGWERPAAWWRPHELEVQIRTWQPGVSINDRLFGVADFTTPEQFVPAAAPSGAWETCMTMNDSWGFNPRDTAYKSARQLIHTWCEVAGKGGSLLLNVSPTGTGALPGEQVSRLEALARWMKRYGSAVAGDGIGAGLEPWQFYGPSTRRGDRVFVHLLARPYESFTVRGVPVRRVEAVTEVATGTSLEWTARTAVLETLLPDPDGELRITVPESLLDADATVVAIDFRA